MSSVCKVLTAWQPARLRTGQRSVGVCSGSQSLSYGVAQGHVAMLLGDPNQPAGLREEEVLSKQPLLPLEVVCFWLSTGPVRASQGL